MIYKEQLMDVYRGLDSRSNTLSEELRQIEKRVPKGTLSPETKHGHPTFTLNSQRDGKRQRHSLAKNPATVDDILKARYLCRQLESVNINRERLKSCIREYSAVGADAYYTELRKQWPAMPYEFIERLQHSLETDPWALEEYEHFSYKDDTKRHRTTRGLLVRSKSEVLIAEKLYEYRIPFRYEQALHIENSVFGPDFTVRRADGKLFYWEHEGLTNSADYMRYQGYKNQMYAQAGIVPWDNLIITYDSLHGNVDLRIVESEIRNKLLI